MAIDFVGKTRLLQIFTLIKGVFDTKQDKLTAGDNITITDNVISATGGGSGFWEGTHAEYEAQKDTIADGTIIYFNDDYTDGAYFKVEADLSTTSEMPVQNKTITVALNELTQTVGQANQLLEGV